MANSSYITLLKRNVKNEIINDPVIVKAFGSPNYDASDPDWSGEDVGENYIFTWHRNLKTITETITFITIRVNTLNYKDKWVIPQLIITIFSHNDHMQLNANDFPGIDANRNDYLSQLIDNKFNGRSTLGNPDDIEKVNLIGELTLSKNEEGMINDSFAYRCMVFETKDINSSICDTW